MSEIVLITGTRKGIGRYLVDHFLAHFRQALGKPIRGITDAALARLVAYPWPGNIRELENVIERGIILSDGESLGVEALPENVRAPSPDSARPGEFGMKRARRTFETDLIRRALRATSGNRTHAARLLEISHRALLYKLKEYGIRD